MPAFVPPIDLTFSRNLNSPSLAGVVFTLIKKNVDIIIHQDFCNKTGGVMVRMISISDYQHSSRIYNLPPERISRVPPDVIELPECASIPLVVRQRWKELNYLIPEISVYCLRDVIVLEQGLVITKYGEVISETVHQYSSSDIEHILSSFQFDMKTCTKATSPLLLMKKTGSTNYGHLLYEMLPLISFAFFLPEKPLFFLDDVDFLNEVAVDVSRLSGYKDDRLFFFDNKSIYCDKLFIVDSITQHSIYASSLVRKFYDLITSEIAPSSHKKIYVSRSHFESGRRFKDTEMVDKFFLDRGYYVVYPEKLTFTEQVAIFKGAELIVGIMGAGLTNILFSPPGSVVVCLMPDIASEVLYWQLSNLASLDYHEIRLPTTGDQIGNLPWDKVMDVDYDFFAKIFKNIESKIDNA